MRICLVSARFPPDRCGVGDYTYFLANALARIGHDVDVVTKVGGTDPFAYPLGANLRVHRVARGWRIADLSGVVRYIRKIDPQLLLIQFTPHSYDRRGITLAINALPALSRIGSTVRVVTNFHELYIPFDRSLKHNLGAVWQRSAALVLAFASHALTVTAIEWERRLRGMGVRKPIEVIPVGSNIPVVPISDEDRIRLRNQLLRGSPHGVLVAGFGARHDRDIPAILFGLQQLKRQVPARLVWIGGGSPDRRHTLEIEQAMRDTGLDENDVEWMGALPHSEVSRLLSACDMMVLPFVDGVSTRRTSAVSALQHGLPVLTTHGGTLDPWFVHAENVYLIPIGDRQALADGLSDLARGPELRARITEGALDLYRARFAWEVIAQQVVHSAEHGGE